MQPRGPAQELIVPDIAVNNGAHSSEAVHALLYRFCNNNGVHSSETLHALLYTSSSVLCGCLHRGLVNCDDAFGLCLIGNKLKLPVLDGLMNMQKTGRGFRNFRTDEISHQHEWLSLLFTLPFSHPSGGV